MSKNKMRGIGIGIVIAIVVLIVGLNSFTVVEAGHTGVVVTLGKVNEGVLQEGIHFKLPFVQKIVEIDNRIVKLTVATEAFSKDLQSVSTQLAVNYRVDRDKSYSIYKNIGANYEQVLLEPAVNEVLKAITSRYTAEESVTNRKMISDGLIEGLNEKLNESGLFITDVNIINFDFSDAFVNAIEEKQIAQQQLLKAETDKQTALTNATAEADAMAAKAKGEAEAMRIKADAEAEANKTISESLSDILLEYSKIEKWDGKLPLYVGNGATPMIDVTDAAAAAEK